VVWANFLKKPLEVICRCPFPASDTACGSGGAPHTKAAHFPVVVIAMASRGHGHGPQGALLASLIAISDATLGAANCITGWCLLITAQGCLPACLCGAVHDRLIVDGMLGRNALRLSKCAPKEVALSTSQWALLAASGQCNWAA
jgi:hypothetical protein